MHPSLGTINTWYKLNVECVIILKAREPLMCCLLAPTGHGNTPSPTLNCFRVGSRQEQHQMGLQMQDFVLQSVAEGKKGSEDQFRVPTSGVHLYDSPMVHTEGRNGLYKHYDEDGGVGHSYEFPDHYHLATQYEVPVAPYEQPRPQARLHIYKNTLPSDIYVPTLVCHGNTYFITTQIHVYVLHTSQEERQKSVSIEKQVIIYIFASNTQRILL